MALPTRKHSRSRRDKKRAWWKPAVPSVTKCPQCAQPVLPHHACTRCGYYRGRQVIVVKEQGSKEA